MTLDKLEVGYLLRLFQQRPPRRRLGSVAEKLQQEHQVGTKRGANVLYTNDDFNRAANLLQLIGIDPTTPVGAWSESGRAEAAALGGSEKWSTAAVHAGMVAVKTLAGKMLLVDGLEFRLPSGAHLELDLEDATNECGHTSLLVVENFEAFHYCHRWQGLDLTRCGGNPLVIYRGDPHGVRADATNELIISLSEKPVFAAFDLDPAGLGMAMGLPRLDGFIGPPHQSLDKWVERGRVDLYVNQVPQWAALLDGTTHPDIVTIWVALCRRGKGVAQEVFNKEFDGRS